MEKISRRAFLKASGAAAVAVPAYGVGGVATAQTVGVTSPTAQFYTFFNSEESAFIEPAVERLIPADENGPGALAAGVPTYIDKQLGGAWGAGERLYRSGPWAAGSPSQGYQLPFTPAELFHNALRAIRTNLSQSGKASFAALTAADQDAYLKALQEGRIELDGVPSKVFFESLWGLTLEGFFSDPVYGGNRDMLAWQMIGFPGAYADYYELVDQHNISYRRRPMSLAENGHGTIQIHPDIPASMHGGHK